MQTILTDLNGTCENIQASALISTDGLVIAEALPQNMDEDTLGAISAALHSVGTRGIEELADGVLEYILVKSSENYILMTHVGKEVILTVILKSQAELDFVMSNIRYAIEKIMAHI
ncbi:MAG: roadblock/LC7 domain-containing protein [Methylovulum sp.]|uniref:roadblock/LC7 domain-containing protein n=1 Tax=Methylovulum sp. TaxID=1916980 RepID=UPI0026336113|nr:roadblock/LC7 domain-containing protein [Methylovulum sp.]MDD2724565.1 roadblock/LC7 domain-containing protein [Methylovulum sp.]MDD5123942.1 roadblock/LC7 domain-containing protein [Methylovulum sp.]